MNQRKFLEEINRKQTGAWKELYRYFYGALCNYVAGIVADDAVAEDIVQECLITVWKSDLNFPEMRALSVYLYRSVHNNALKYLRDRNVNSLRLKNWYSVQDEVEEFDFYRAVEEEMIRKLKMAIDGLPGQRHEILMLSLQGLSVQEIADQLNISVNTVKTQKKRAYAYLKECLRHSFFVLVSLGFFEKI